MTEILYSPKHNELFLFTGAYEIDDIKKTMILYLVGNKKKLAHLESKDLIHVGWL